MKSNVVKKVVSLVLAIMMLMISTVIYASNPQIDVTSIIQPRWTYLYSCENSLEITEGTSKKLTIYATTDVYTGYAGVNAQLQKLSEDGTSWDDVPNKFWEAYEERTVAGILIENVSVSSGKYRCSLEHIAYSTNGMPLESFYTYTNTVTVY